MEKSYEERVKNAKLTKTGKKIAEYILQNKSVAVFQPLSAIASDLQISDVSIVRFARSIGYDGFIDLKQALQKELLSSIDEKPESVNTVMKFVVNKELRSGEMNFSTFNSFEVYSELLQDTLQRNNIDAFDQAAKKLINSDKKYIIGWRSRIGAVHTMALLLELLLPNVTAITEDSYRSFLRISHLTEKDCVVLFSFGRFPDIERDLLNAVKKSGAYLIVISDQRITPSSLAANLLIYSRANTKHLFYSNLSNVMIAEIIANNVAESNWDKSKDPVNRSENYINNHMAKDE